MSLAPAAFFTFAVIVVIALLGVGALRLSDASSHKAEIPAAPAAYVASPADLFEQRVAARRPATYVASDADLFEQRVAARRPATYVASPADLFEQRVAG